MSGPSHGTVILAAGTSTRLGRAKQLIDVDGEPALRRVVRAALETEPRDCIVVLGHDAEAIGSALHGLAARMVRIEDFASGMAASLRAGVAALDRECAGALVMLTDQPALTADHLRALRDAWRVTPERAVASAYGDVRGVPALLPRAWFDDIAALRGDVGARALLRARDREVISVAAPELARDLDTPEDVQNM